MRGLALLVLIAFAGCSVPHKDGPPISKRCAQDVAVTSFDGTKLAADCYPGNGKTIVLIHGAFQSRVVWERQIESLAGRYQLISYDLRGHGESGRPTSAEAFSENRVPGRDTEAVLDYFGVSRAVIVGWSFGSIVASDAAVQLGADRVAGLVLVSGTIESNTQRNRENFGPLSREIAAMRSEGGVAADEDAARRFVSDSYQVGKWDPQLLDRVLKANLSMSPEERTRAVLRPSHRYASKLNSLGIPVLLIHGKADNAFSVDSSIAAHEDLGHSALIKYEHTGHWPFLEKSDRFNTDVARFVDSVR